MRIHTFNPPTLTEVFCPYVGWTVARDGFCFECGATDHETEQDMADSAPRGSYVDGWD